MSFSASVRIAIPCSRRRSRHYLRSRQVQALRRAARERAGGAIFLPCDMQAPGQLDAVFQAISQTWGRLDFALHAIAFAPKADLHGRLADCSRDGFLVAMDISCHSFMRMARLAEPLMTSGGAIFTLTYYGGEKVIEHYNVMGPVKAARESAVRYLAYEFGPKGIRVLPFPQVR